MYVKIRMGPDLERSDLAGWGCVGKWMVILTFVDVGLLELSSTE